MQWVALTTLLALPLRTGVATGLTPSQVSSMRQALYPVMPELRVYLLMHSASTWLLVVLLLMVLLLG